MKLKIKKELKLKDGTVFPVGTELNIGNFINDRSVEVSSEGRDMRIRTTTLAYLMGKKAPSINTLQRWSDDGVAKSVLGKRIEPDGHDEYGSPSWLLVMGLI